MRAATGCRECRERHLKCVFKDGSEACQQCQAKRRECEKASSIRFRNVIKSKKRDLFRYREGQQWIDITGNVKFDAQNGGEGATRQERLPAFDGDTNGSLHERAVITSPEEAAQQSLHILADAGAARCLAEPKPTAAQNSPDRSTPANLPTYLASHQSPASISEGRVGQIVPLPSPFSTTPRLSLGSSDVGSPWIPRSSKLYKFSPAWPLHNIEEARLLSHYILKLSPWVCTEVSRRRLW